MMSLNINDLFSIKGKTALITGGSRGIGLMIAQTFVENGAKIYISSRKKGVCDAVADKLSEIGTCISIPADLSTSEGRDNLVNELKSREDSLDILINNAGAAWGAPFETHPESAYDKIMDLNVKSVFMLTQQLMPLIEKNASLENPKRIINIGSIDGLRAAAMDTSVYGTSKAALHHLTKFLATKIAQKGITVNAIAPGPFESKMTAGMLEAFQSHIEKTCPLKRIGQPSDVGGLALFLSSPAASYLNGTVIPLDGGLHLMSRI